MKEARLKELISEWSTANIDFLLRNWNDKQYNELNPIGRHHSLDGVTYSKYKLLPFLTKIFLQSEEGTSF